MWALVEATCLAVNVEALNVWSACSMRHTSNIFSTSGSGLSPDIICRKLAAWPSDGSGSTRGRLLRMRCQLATIVGTLPSRFDALS